MPGLCQRTKDTLREHRRAGLPKDFHGEIPLGQPTNRRTLFRHSVGFINERICQTYRRTQGARRHIWQAALRPIFELLEVRFRSWLSRMVRLAILEDACPLLKAEGYDWNELVTVRPSTIPKVTIYIRSHTERHPVIRMSVGSTLLIKTSNTHCEDSKAHGNQHEGSGRPESEE